MKTDKLSGTFLGLCRDHFQGMCILLTQLTSSPFLVKGLSTHLAEVCDDDGEGLVYA